MRATNPSLWNYWKENLLNELYNATNRLYRLGMASEDLQEHRLGARKKESHELLTDAGIDPLKIEAFWARLPDEYFLRHSVDDIVWQTRELIEKDFSPTPIICTRGDKRRGITIVFLYAEDQANLFAHCASALAQLRLDITDARILETRDSYALNTYIVHDEQGNPIMDPMELGIIEKRIRSAISEKDAPAATVDTRIPRTLQQFKVRTFLEFEQDELNKRTILRLRTTDRPGILSRVGQVFMEHDIRLHNARVATFGERAEDSFFISTPDKKPITDTRLLGALKNDIINTLSSD
jgi:[protein-PII] uridylyltransferase